MSKSKTNQETKLIGRIRDVEDVRRIKILEDAIISIFKAHGVVISTGQTLGGAGQRHLVPAINDAWKLISQERREELWKKVSYGGSE